MCSPVKKVRLVFWRPVEPPLPATKQSFSVRLISIGRKRELWSSLVCSVASVYGSLQSLIYAQLFSSSVRLEICCCAEDHCPVSFAPSFSCHTERLTLDFRILWFTQEFVIESVTARGPGPVAKHLHIGLACPRHVVLEVDAALPTKPCCRSFLLATLPNTPHLFSRFLVGLL